MCLGTSAVTVPWSVPLESYYFTAAVWAQPTLNMTVVLSPVQSLCVPYLHDSCSLNPVSPPDRRSAANARSSLRVAHTASCVISFAPMQVLPVCVCVN